MHKLCAPGVWTKLLDNKISNDSIHCVTSVHLHLPVSANLSYLECAYICHIYDEEEYAHVHNVEMKTNLTCDSTTRIKSLPLVFFYSFHDRQVDLELFIK